MKARYWGRKGWELVDVVKTSVSPTGVATFLVKLGDGIINTCLLDHRFRLGTGNLVASPKRPVFPVGDGRPEPTASERWVREWRAAVAQRAHWARMARFGRLSR
jgi:hypothetical protein